MPVARANNQTGFLGATLAAGTGVGGSINLGAAWLDVTVSGPSYVKLLLQPPVIAGQPSLAFEAVYATVINGSSTATIVARGQEGTTAQAHNLGTVWTCGPTAQDFTSDLGPIAETQVTNLTTDLAAKATVTALSAETTRATAGEATNATAISTETTRATAAEALLAPLASPALTGTPTAPTKPALTNNTDLATTAYADAAVGVAVTNFATPGTSAPADVAAPGAATTLVRADHKHGREAWALIGDLTADGVAALGAAGRVPDAAHVHPGLTIDARIYGVAGDGKSVSDGNITSGQAVLTTTTSTPFLVTDVGKAIVVGGAGGNPSGELRTTISAFTSSSSVTLAANATKTVTSRTVADAVTNGTTTVTSATAAFVAADVNRPLTGTNIPPNTVIATVTNGTTIVLSQAAMGSSGAGSLTVNVGVQWGTEGASSASTGINAAILAAAASGVLSVIMLPPGRIVCTQALRFGVLNTSTTNTILLRGQGMQSTVLVFPNSNSLGLLQPVGANTTTQIPQLLFEDLTFDMCYSGIGTDGVLNKLAAGAAAFWQLPYPFNCTTPVVYPGQAATLTGNYRTDLNCSINSGTPTTVTDAAVLASDLGSLVQGAGIPAGTFISAVTAGVSFTLSNAYTGVTTTTETLYIYLPTGSNANGVTYAKTNTNQTLTNGANTLGFTGTQVTATDIGSHVSSSTAGIPVGTVITAVNTGTHIATLSANFTGTTGSTYTVYVRPFGLSTATTATTLTDANAAWTPNQWIGWRVAIDEHMAILGTNVGAGYAPVIANTATTLVVAGWVGTKITGAYTPSGNVVPYRLQGDVFKGYHHRAERVRFYRPSGFAVQAARGDFSYSLFDSCGQPPATTHSDNVGSGGTHVVLDHCRFIGCAGNYVDMSASFPGLFPNANVFMCEEYNRAGNGGLYCGGVGSRFVANHLENPVTGSGVSIDVTTHAACRGRNVLEANTLVNMNINAGGFQSAHGDRSMGNVAQDSPLGVMGVQPTIPATTVPFYNGTVACDCTVYVTAGAGSTTVVAINGTTVQTIAASATASIRVPSGTSITLTYTSAPTWIWVGD